MIIPINGFLKSQNGESPALASPDIHAPKQIGHFNGGHKYHVSLKMISSYRIIVSTSKIAIDLVGLSIRCLTYNIPSSPWLVLPNRNRLC